MDSWLLLGVALLNCMTAFFSWQTRQVARQTEVNTNSLVTRLVATTKAEAHAKGFDEAKVEGEHVANALAKGQEQGRANPRP